MHRPRFTRRVRPVAVLVATTLVLGACGDLTVPDYNNPSIESLRGNPTPTTIAQAAQGMLIGSRTYMGAQNGYVSLLGIVGRESYNFDPADPRFITEMLIGPLDPGSPAFGANLYAFFYRNIRLGNTLLDAVGGVGGLSDAQKEAVRGFVKTIQAHDFLMLINTRDDLGVPIDVGIEPTGPPAPIVPKAQVFARIVQLLEEANTHLAAGGTAFPFSLGGGFAGLNTPSTFRQFNRALKARVDVYMGNYSAALTSLGASFLDPNASLDLGAYHVFSTTSGDLDNQIYDPQGRAILAHPTIVTEAQPKANGAPDDRLTRKVTQLAEARTVQGVTTDRLFTIYNSPEAPIPIIRNEGLILLRAEARYFTGNTAGALEDINLIRQRSGGLPARGAFTSNDDFVAELLYNRRYSLLFEGGHRWIDARRFNRLGQLPRALTTHTVPSRFPYPESECLARDPAPAQGC
jgi:starch-binding outer membrane protein, SusD/RagB family